MKAGWRHFECPECGLFFNETSRDFESPSLSNCPGCNEEVFPCDRWPDSSLMTDKSGNLMHTATSYYGTKLDEHRERAREKKWEKIQAQFA